MGPLVLLLALLGQGGTENDDLFSSCVRAFEQDPWSWDSSNCFFLTAKQHGTWERAEKLLKERLAIQDNYWIYNALGRIAYESGRELAAPFFEKAIASALRKGNVDGALRARLNLIRCLLDAYQNEAAGKQLALAEETVARLSDKGSEVEVVLLRVRHIMESGGDLEYAGLLLDRVENSVFGEDHFELRRDWLLNRGNIFYELGRYSLARTCFEKLLALASARGDHYLLAVANWNLAGCLLQGENPTPANRARLKDLGRAALQAASDGRNRDLEAFLTTEVGRLLEGGEADAHLQRGIALARSGNNLATLSKALGFSALRIVDEDPRRARQLLTEALRIARDLEGPWPILYTWHPRLTVQWRTLPPDRALDDSLELLDFIEALRGPQLIESGRIDLFSVWTEIYYWLAGHLLRVSADQPDSGYLEKAFLITERMRARVLLDALDRAGASRALPETHPHSVKMRSVNSERVRIHRLLMVPTLEKAERDALVSELEHWENEMEALSRRVLEEIPNLGTVHRPKLADLKTLQNGLAENQAVLAFHIAFWEDFYGLFRGGSWLWVITRGHVKTYPLPDQMELEPALNLFFDLLLNEADPAIIRSASVSLYRRLFKDPLRQLPRDITELIIIPDQPLYRLPFGVLRETETSPPLAMRFRTTIAPSATLWLRWQTGSAERPYPSILVFADPELEGTGQTTSRVPVRSFTQGQPLEPLPRAKSEGRAIVSLLGDKGALLMGSRASETALKQIESASCNIIHFATHALMDREHPQRSAIVLSPGHVDEDGLLLPAEIAALRLQDQMVVLSSCQSAGGLTRQGEGVMSLARAFSRAGAQSVIGTLWPMRDDHAALFFKAFYQRLAKGDQLSEALQAVRKDRIEAGSPPKAWAGVVLIGNGNLAFHPVSPSITRHIKLWLLLPSAVLAIGAGLWLKQRKQKKLRRV